MDDERGIWEVRHSLAEEGRRQIVERIARVAQNAEGVVAVFLHGSFAREEEPFRDIDLAVLPAEGITDQARRAAAEAFDAATAPYDADIRWLDEAPTHFCYRVIAAGRMAWESEPVVRADFVERILIEHFDTVWMREELLRGALGLDR